MAFYIREATEQDNAALRDLQARCPQGLGLKVTTINRPDFFARAKAYPTWKVFNAYAESGQLLGSAACALRKAVINHQPCKIGYEFQYFVAEEARNQGVGRLLRQTIENYLRQQEAVLSYALIIDGNLPSMRLFESQGFTRYKKLTTAIVLTHKKVSLNLTTKQKIRPLRDDHREYAQLAELLNQTWLTADFAEPFDETSLREYLGRLPQNDPANVSVLEENGQIVACLGFWDLSQILQIQVEALSQNLALTGKVLDLVRPLYAVPRLPQVGESMQQWCLLPVGFKDSRQLTLLAQHINNLAMEQGGNKQLMLLADAGQPLAQALKGQGLFQVTSGLQLYVKQLALSPVLRNGPVFIDARDI